MTSSLLAITFIACSTVTATQEPDVEIGIDCGIRSQFVRWLAFISNFPSMSELEDYVGHHQFREAVEERSSTEGLSNEWREVFLERLTSNMLLLEAWHDNQIKILGVSVEVCNTERTRGELVFYYLSRDNDTRSKVIPFRASKNKRWQRSFYLSNNYSELTNESATAILQTHTENKN
ncbi:MAG: hypothetical protein AAFM91_15170 [Pseudomonadota bacterium]